MKIDYKQIRENSFGRYMNLLVLKSNAMLRKELGPLNLSIRNCAILMILSEKEGINQAELGRAVGVPGYTTTRVLDNMAARGLLERRPDPNSRRTNKIYLTRKGKATAQKMPEIIHRLNDKFLYPLNETERLQGLGILKKLWRYHSEQTDNR